MKYPEFHTDVQSLNIALDKLLQHRELIFIIADENTAAHCLVLLDLNRPFHLIELCPGETNKSFDVYGNICQTLLEEGADRSSVIINLGGGVITDIGGFTGSTFHRGLPFIHVPTSLTAMADAALGGKTGIDLGKTKNVLGTIADPEAILICPEFLQTLPAREHRSGLVEMLKHGLIADQNHWNRVKKILADEKISLELIRDSAAIKMDIVTRDPLDYGTRQLLNFGHTIGHAIESVMMETAAPWTHGEAIAAGIFVETMISKQKNLINTSESDEIFEVLTSLIPASFKDVEFEKLWEFLLKDKKKHQGKIIITLIKKIGEGLTGSYCSKEECREAFETAVARFTL